MEEETILNGHKRTKCEIWSRIVGYMRPVDTWNGSKQQEFGERKMFKFTD